MPIGDIQTVDLVGQTIDQAKKNKPPFPELEGLKEDDISPMVIEKIAVLEMKDDNALIMIKAVDANGKILMAQLPASLWKLISAGIHKWEGTFAMLKAKKN